MAHDLGADARRARPPPTGSAAPGSLRPGEAAYALLGDFIVFEDDGGKLAKIMAGYHQFHAARVAVTETVRASEMAQFAEPTGRYETGQNPGGSPGTGASGSSGTPKARERA